jgi:hypothetical protein
MERKDAFILLAFAGALSYGAYANWDAISARLGLDDLMPGRVKAIEYAKTANSFETSRPNWQVVEQWKASGDIQYEGNPWTADKLDENHYRVVLNYRKDGAKRAITFNVDNIKGSVVLNDDAAALPAPR